MNKLHTARVSATTLPSNFQRSRYSSADYSNPARKRKKQNRNILKNPSTIKNRIHGKKPRDHGQLYMREKYYKKGVFIISTRVFFGFFTLKMLFM